MTIEIPATSRFSVHENPNREPGFCCVCRSPGGDGRQFVDFGMQLDWYGAVYFCTFCVKELCEAAGFVESDIYESLKATNSHLAKELNATTESFKDYRDATRTMLRDCNCSDSGNAVSKHSDNPEPKPSKSRVKADDSDSV